MEHRALGRSGLEVSRIILGCGNFGGLGSSTAHFGAGETEGEAHAIMDAAWEAGITTFDTADAYGGGRSESFIGSWLRAKSPDVREQIVLTTKTFNPMSDGADHGLSRERILRQIDGSLERLGVESVPLYLAHDMDPAVPVAETIGAFDTLVADGKIRAYGGSNVDVAWLEAALGIGRPDWAQNSYSLLDREPEHGVLEVCARAGLGFTPFSPLAGGWLTGKYKRGEKPPAGSRMTLRPEPYLHLQEDAVFDALEALDVQADERATTPATLAFAWLLAHPHVTAVVVGPRRPEQLRPALDALELESLPARARPADLTLHMSVLVLSEHDVRRLLPMDECIEAMDAVLRSLARGELHQPLRFLTRPPNAESLMGFMPAHRGGDGSVWSLKEIVIAPGNPARGLDAHQGAVLLHDGETGELRALLNASPITEIRTAAVSAVATRALARPDARVVAILGAGVQARSHTEAMRAVLGDAEIRTWSRGDGGTPEQVLRGADVVCTCTSAREPILQRDWLSAGTHVNAVGASLPTVRELDTETMAAAGLFVDRRESTLNESGDLLLAGLGEEHIRAELGEVLIGAHPGRTDGEELTVFKSLGLAVEDLAAAELIVRKAREQGGGTEVQF